VALPRRGTPRRRHGPPVPRYGLGFLASQFVGVKENLMDVTPGGKTASFVPSGMVSTTRIEYKSLQQQ
jgi:hypothetical protein